MEPTNSEYASLETNEIVGNNTTQTVKTESAITPVDLGPMVKPTPAEVEVKQTEVIADLKPNYLAFVQSSESTRMPLPSGQTPNLYADSATWETALVEILLGRKKTVKSIDEAVQVQLESEDQPVRTVSRENPVEEVLTNSICVFFICARVNVFNCCIQNTN